jgi:tRNA (guanine10-N2)-methyltransferase
VIEGFAYLGLDGVIKMNNPEITFCVFEEYLPGKASIPARVLFGRLVARGSRHLVEKYDLKKRHYIGTTSMDAELALVTANMALAAPGRMVYDPFVGTGSFIVSCAHFGALSLGSDIDGRQIRGKSGRSVLGNFHQYGLVGRYLDGFVSDLTNSPLRKTAFLDAIVCDPPYGVREGLKVLGSRDPEKGKEPAVRDGELRHLCVLLPWCCEYAHSPQSQIDNTTMFPLKDPTASLQCWKIYSSLPPTASSLVEGYASGCPPPTKTSPSWTSPHIPN